MTTYTGGCLCGQIRYAFDAQTLEGGSCYCRDCQRATGSPLTTVTMTDTLRVSGETRTYSLQSAADRTVTRHFCPTCGRGMTQGGRMLQGMASFAIAVKLWPRIGNRERMHYELSHRVPNGREPKNRKPKPLRVVWSIRAQ